MINDITNASIINASEKRISGFQGAIFVAIFTIRPGAKRNAVAREPLIGS